jgi:flagellar motor switch protein FliN
MTPLEKSEHDLDQAIRELNGEIHKPEEVSMKGNESNPNTPGSLMKIVLKVQVAIGACEISVGDLSNLCPGQTISLNKLVGDPVDIVANGTRIGTGLLVAIPGPSPTFGLKIQTLTD